MDNQIQFFYDVQKCRFIFDSKVIHNKKASMLILSGFNVEAINQPEIETNFIGKPIHNKVIFDLHKSWFMVVPNGKQTYIDNNEAKQFFNIGFQFQTLFDGIVE